MKKYRKVILVAGHSDYDSGAVSDGFKESEFTKKNRDGLRYFLNKHYPEIEVLTDDDSKSLSDVIRWIKSVEGKDSIVIDNHWNSASVNTATGHEAFVADNASQKSHEIADDILKTMVSITGFPNRGVKTESQSNRGKLGILRTASPACLVEWGFINNPHDRGEITEWDGWIYEDVAHAIARQALIK